MANSFLDLETLWLDYKGAPKTKKILSALSGAAAVGDYLWTVSDEGRTVECLKRAGDEFQFHRQIKLDDVFKGLRGAKSGDEIDLESIEIAGGALWLCGSHCRVRKEEENSFDPPRRLYPHLRDRTSRRLLGRLTLNKEGDDIKGKGAALPPAGAKSLRSVLAQNEYLAPFVPLPSKENGLDIEGMAFFDKTVLLGLRGPLINSVAVVVQLTLTRAMQIRSLALHFLNLEGLGVRDLTAWGDNVLVLAGPVSSADAPFRLYRWKPNDKGEGRVQRPTLVGELPVGNGHLEGMCRLTHQGRDGLLLLHDRDAATETRYAANWLDGEAIGRSPQESANVVVLETPRTDNSAA